MFHSLGAAVAVPKRNNEMATAIPILIDPILTIDLIFPSYDVTGVPSIHIVGDPTENTQYPTLGSIVVTA